MDVCPVGSAQKGIDVRRQFYERAGSRATKDAAHLHRDRYT